MLIAICCLIGISLYVAGGCCCLRLYRYAYGTKEAFDETAAVAVMFWFWPAPMIWIVPRAIAVRMDFDIPIKNWIL